MNLSLFFIHKGSNNYLKYVLRQARFFNPTIDIYLLGDKTNQKFTYIRHYMIKDYNQQAEKFMKIYKHLSIQDYNYELFCFQRWFILNEFVQAQDISNSIMYIDSDVLLYCNLSTYFGFLNQFRITVCNKRGPQYTFFQDKSILKKFCDFITDYYSNNILIDELKNWFEKYKKNNISGGVCDMTLYEKYVSRFLDKKAELTNIIDNKTFDDNINISGGYEMDYNLKKIYWINKKPYGKLIENNQLVSFLALHFQGSDSKFVIQRYYRGNNFFMEKLIDELIYYLRIIIKKILKHRK